MQNNKLTIKRIGLAFLLTLISVSSLAAPSADAMSSDRRISASLQDKRDQLLIEEKRLLQDSDELQRQIRSIQQVDVDPKVVDQLCRDLDEKNNDLKQLEYDLKRVETMMM